MGHFIILLEISSYPEESLVFIVFIIVSISCVEAKRLTKTTNRKSIQTVYWILDRKYMVHDWLITFLRRHYDPYKTLVPMNQTTPSYMPEDSNFQTLSYRNENYKSHIAFKEHLVVAAYRNLFSLRVSGKILRYMTSRIQSLHWIEVVITTDTGITLSFQLLRLLWKHTSKLALCYVRKQGHDTG
jgi:hypothetical protein